MIGNPPGYILYKGMDSLMVHLLFLLSGLGLAVSGQLVILLWLKKVHSWGLKRSLQLLALAMPGSVVALFSFAMLPQLPGNFGSASLQANHAGSPAMELSLDESLVIIGGLALVSLPIGLALLLNLVKVIGLYWRVANSGWPAPSGLAKLLTKINSAPGVNPQKVKIKLWAANQPFAFNLPGLLPGQPAQIVVSTRLVSQLTENELGTVLAHEMAHLARRDFQVVWLASWLKDAFFYLPTGHRFMQILQADKEFACDEMVARSGGLTGTLALAEALLKVWEEFLANNPKPYPVLSGYFEAPGLISIKPADSVSIAEQRVTRLLELGESGKCYKLPNATFLQKLRNSTLFSGSVGLWFLVLELIHLIMLPLGCAISLGVF